MSKVAEATAALEDAFRKIVPRSRKKATDEAEWAAGLKRFYGEAKDIRQRYSLGVIGRARAGYRLQQRLAAAGYPSHVVREVVFSLILNAFSGKAK